MKHTYNREEDRYILSRHEEMSDSKIGKVLGGRTKHQIRGRRRILESAGVTLENLDEWHDQHRTDQNDRPREDEDTGGVELGTTVDDLPKGEKLVEESISDNENREKGTKNLRSETRYIENVDQLIDHMKIDLDVWYVADQTVKSYQGYAKNDAGEIEYAQLFSVTAKLKRRATPAQVSFAQYFEKKYPAPEPRPVPGSLKHLQTEVQPYMGVLAVFDPHLGKLAWDREVWENYDLSIAREVYRAAVDELLAMMQPYQPEKILFPIGNDFLHIDSKTNTTTAGTPQDVDGRFQKIKEIGFDLLVEAIEKCLEIVPEVEVVVVPGNHDEESMGTLAIGLRHYLTHKHPGRVHFVHAIQSRKFVFYGETGLVFAHGDKVKFDRTALSILRDPSYRKEMGGRRFVELLTGHLHKKSEIRYHAVNEEGGIVHRILPSIAPADQWHYDNSYLSNRAAQALMYHKKTGCRAQLEAPIIGDTLEEILKNLNGSK